MIALEIITPSKIQNPFFFVISSSCKMMKANDGAQIEKIANKQHGKLFVKFKE